MPKTIKAVNDGLSVFICAVGSGAIDKKGNIHLSLDLKSEDEVDRAIDELARQLVRAKNKGKKEIRNNKNSPLYPQDKSKR